MEEGRFFRQASIVYYVRTYTYYSWFQMKEHLSAGPDQNFQLPPAPFTTFLALMHSAVPRI